MKGITRKSNSIERRPEPDMHEEVIRSQTEKIVQLSSDPTWTENRGDGKGETIVNNPMLNTDMMVRCFARAIRRDVIMSDTLAHKNPFRPGPNPTDRNDYNRY